MDSGCCLYSSSNTQLNRVNRLLGLDEDASSNCQTINVNKTVFFRSRPSHNSGAAVRECKKSSNRLQQYCSRAVGHKVH